MQEFSQQFNRIFDSKNANWSPDSVGNYLFLQATQRFAEQLRRARGHVLLNDVYDMLGFERTTHGCIYGWIDKPVMFFDNTFDESPGTPVYEVRPLPQGIIYTRLSN